MALLTALDFPLETTCSLVSRMHKSATGDNNFGKWKGTFRSGPTEMTRPVTGEPPSKGWLPFDKKSGWGVESVMVNDLPVYRRNARSVTV